jgi:hypothetical protein
MRAAAPVAAVASPKFPAGFVRDHEACHLQARILGRMTYICAIYSMPTQKSCLCEPISTRNTEEATGFLRFSLPPIAVTGLRRMPTAYPDVPDALAKLRDAGFLLIVTTNQPEVARGKQTRAVAEAINWYALSQPVPYLRLECALSSRRLAATKAFSTAAPWRLRGSLGTRRQARVVSSGTRQISAKPWDTRTKMLYN